MPINNAKTFGKIFYGLHFAPGLAEYKEPDREAYRILINEDTIREMNATFAGKPLYVHHVEDVNLEKLHEADGFVVDSFYNAADGMTWAKFIVISDRGHEAIAKGWKLSNAYIPKNFKAGGMWHGMDYQKEVVAAEYEHLAIVPNPRYDESIILTPEQFKKYNEDKQLELVRVANSKAKGDGSMSKLLNFFKKTKVEDSADLENMSIVLPKSGVEKTVAGIVNELDEHLVNMGMPEHMANEEHMVMVGEDKMAIKDLVAKHMQCMNELAEMKKAKDGASAEAGEGQASGESEKVAESEVKDPALDGEKKENEESAEDKAKKMENSMFFDALVNAPAIANKKSETIELSADKAARGKARYGSN